jgi:hypothetical protein
MNSYFEWNIVLNVQGTNLGLNNIIQITINIVVITSTNQSTYIINSIMGNSEKVNIVIGTHDYRATKW